jgi:DNA-binding transcriptional regulator YiaG
MESKLFEKLEKSVTQAGAIARGERKPTGPAKALLRIVEREPALALRALMPADTA